MVEPSPASRPAIGARGRERVAPSSSSFLVADDDAVRLGRSTVSLNLRLMPSTARRQGARRRRARRRRTWRAHHAASPSGWRRRRCRHLGISPLLAAGAAHARRRGSQAPRSCVARLEPARPPQSARRRAARGAAPRARRRSAAHGARRSTGATRRLVPRTAAALSRSAWPRRVAAAALSAPRRARARRRRLACATRGAPLAGPRCCARLRRTQSTRLRRRGRRDRTARLLIVVDDALRRARTAPPRARVLRASPSATRACDPSAYGARAPRAIVVASSSASTRRRRPAAREASFGRYTIREARI